MTCQARQLVLFRKRFIAKCRALLALLSLTCQVAQAADEIRWLNDGTEAREILKFFATELTPSNKSMSVYSSIAIFESSALVRISSRDDSLETTCGKPKREKFYSFNRKTLQKTPIDNFPVRDHLIDSRFLGATVIKGPAPDIYLEFDWYGEHYVSGHLGVFRFDSKTQRWDYDGVLTLSNGDDEGCYWILIPHPHTPIEANKCEFAGVDDGWWSTTHNKSGPIRREIDKAPWDLLAERAGNTPSSLSSENKVEVPEILVAPPQNDISSAKSPENELIKKPDFAQYGGSDYSNAIRVERGITLKEAFAIASKDPKIGYFFFTTGVQMVLNVSTDFNPANNPLGLAKQTGGEGYVRVFHQGDTVFFANKGKWLGTAPGLADVYEKKDEELPSKK